MGETYTVVGTLMDKASGRALKDDNGDAVTATKRVTIEGTGVVASGTIQMDFTFDASALGGKTLVVFEEIYDVAGKLVGSHKDINDEGQTVYVPDIETTLVDSATGGHEAKPGETVTLIDTVEYTNLVVGNTYTMTGKLMDKETGAAVTDADGNEITATTTFTAETADGSVELSFTFDASLMAGKSVVAFESLHRGDREFATHADLTDEDQTVHFPEIGTTATHDDGDKLVESTGKKNIKIVDEVAYKNLIVGQEYTVTGVLMDKETGTALVGADGKEFTASKTFEAKSTEGYVEIVFTVPAEVLAGKTTVAFETLYKGKDVTVDTNIIGEHKDIDDEDQTVYSFEMGTTATDGDGDKEIAEKANVTVVDTIAYKNLLVGETYVFTGYLVDKANGKPIKDYNGDQIEASKKVTIEGTGIVASGTVELVYTLDASTLGGKTLVVFEDVYDTTGKIIGSHRDLNDLEQTVYIPDIRTTLVDDVTGGHTALPGEKVTLTDTVLYTNLIVGKEYTMTGTLMDKETGLAVVDPETQEAVTASTTFTAETTDGSVELHFTLDASLMAGKSVVAFESLHRDDKEFAVHADLTDEDQTVHFPAIGTTATDKNGEKEIESTGEVTIVDVVEYKNLIPGEKYTLVGTLMEKETGLPLIYADTQEPITVTKTFTPETADGTVEMEFEIEISELGEMAVVVFESLYVGSPDIETNIVAEHEDLEDEDQTVWFVYSGELTKIDATSEEPLAGVTVLITDLTAEVEYTCVTDENGLAKFALVAGHKYTYQEVAALDGYILDKTVYEFTVDENGIPDDDLILRNVREGVVVLSKSDVITGDPVKGAEITVYDKDGKALFTQLTDKFGRIYFDPGDMVGEYTYKYRETAAPDGYYLNEDVYSFTIAADGTVSGTTKFTDVPYGTIVLKKTDANGAPLKGAVFSIYNADGRKLGSGKTNDYGRVYFVAPSVGNYYFVEEVAPEGYILNTQKQAFSITADGVISGTTSLVNQKGDSGPKTGDVGIPDSLYLYILASLSTAAACGVAALTLYKKRQREAQEQGSES